MLEGAPTKIKLNMESALTLCTSDLHATPFDRTFSTRPVRGYLLPAVEPFLTASINSPKTLSKEEVSLRDERRYD